MMEQNNREIEILEEIKSLIAFKEFDALLEYLESLHYIDIADIMDEFDKEEKNTLFELIPVEFASGILEELEPKAFSNLLKDLDDRKKHLILDEMSQDDIVDKLEDLSDERIIEIFKHMDIEDSRMIKKLLAYESDVAGGLMTGEFISMVEDITKSEALEYLKSNAPDAETIYYTFVVDNQRKLVGVLSLRDLILAENDTKIVEIMHRNVISVNVYDDQEEVAQVVSKYDLLAVPVVNNFDKIVGIITVDDIIDVIEEEATEDIMKFAGTTENDTSEENTVFENIISSTKSRLPWLIITVFGGLLSASIVREFQGVLNANTVLALFMPLLAGMGGNVGTQSSTITVRNIAVGSIETKDIPITLFHEITVGIIVGIICAILVAIASFILNGELIISMIVGISMTANIITAATIGTVVPLVFKKINIDPAVASAPFITTTVDITGLTIYFSMATFLISKFG
ncbi:magnesium transporter [Clostridiaceae bacterium HSG29]|nr:magnesium transporter [Clostridiaceae bacterium HSG29]